MAQTEGISLLRALYTGRVPLAKVFWGYWLGLGILTWLLWCLVVAVPFMLLYEGVSGLIGHAFDVPREYGDWREWSRWIVLAFLPVFVAPGYALFHSLIMFLPLERAAKHTTAGQSFWRTRLGIFLCLLPPLLVMLPGLLFMMMGFLIAFGGGLVSVGMKLATFTLGLLPHALLLFVLGRIRFSGNPVTEGETHG